MDNNNPTEVDATPVEEVKVYTAAEMENARAAHRQSMQTLDVTYRNVVGVFADAVDMGDMERATAIQMLNDAGIPEHYFEHLSHVTVEVEIEITATVTYTETVTVKVNAEEAEDDDALLDAVYDSTSLEDIITDNGYSLNVVNCEAEVQGYEAV
jgi:hypothetical protein